MRTAKPVAAVVFMLLAAPAATYGGKRLSLPIATRQAKLHTSR